MLGGVCWYITIGTRRGEINFMKGLFFIASCIGLGMFLLTISFLIPTKYKKFPVTRAGYLIGLLSGHYCRWVIFWL